jgi:hypothetical protein
MSDIVSRLRTVKVSESRHIGFTYETWAGEAADEIEHSRARLREYRRILEAIEAEMREQAVGEQCGVLLDLANRLKATLIEINR